MDGNSFHPVRGQQVAAAKLERSRELRHQMTEAEHVLWERLRRGQMSGLRFRRQQVLHGFIVDFYCHAARLVLEVDGEVHANQVEYDIARDAVLVMHGLRVLRFTNDAILKTLPDVLAHIHSSCNAVHSSTPSPFEPGGQK